MALQQCTTERITANDKMKYATEAALRTKREWEMISNLWIVSNVNISQ